MLCNKISKFHIFPSRTFLQLTRYLCTSIKEPSTKSDRSDSVVIPNNAELETEKLQGDGEQKSSRKLHAPYNSVFRRRQAYQKLNNLRKISEAVVPDAEDSLSVGAKFFYSEAPEELKKVWTQEVLKEVKQDLPETPLLYPYAKYINIEHEQTVSNLPGNEAEQYGYDEILETELDPELMRINYGSPKPSVPKSNVPCGGCGAILHCQDPGVPGYMPSERFTNLKNHELRRLVCQRCLFLQKYNTALQVNISPDEYPKIISQIKDKFALVILMVDLLDFPCSIWPGIVDLIGGPSRPIYVVGNKVDLLPKDDDAYLKNIHNALCQAVVDIGLARRNNIRHVQLISAKTGYGVENLINKIHFQWAGKGDIYLVGCTNTGKSTLFNTFLQSDLCKVDAADIVKKATTSPWPGTTLNFLKFPILRADRWRKHVRAARLYSEKHDEEAEKVANKTMFEKTGDLKYATLSGHVGMSFRDPDKEIPEHVKDNFLVTLVNQKVPQPITPSFNPKDKKFSDGKWCYDTPGSINNNQLINILTLDELMMTLPKQLIKPRTFIVNRGYALLLGGIGRVDFLQGGEHVYYTVFSSTELPVSVVQLNEVDEFYETHLGTDVLQVPFGDKKRVEEFPPLVSKSFTVNAVDFRNSCCDIVLSSAGFLSVTLERGEYGKFRAYTPAGLGCYVRQPSMLPKAVTMRGDRLKYTPAYKPNIIKL